MEVSIFLYLDRILNESDKEIWVWKRSKLTAHFSRDHIREIYITKDPVLVLVIISIFDQEIYISPSELRKLTIHNRINLVLS